MTSRSELETYLSELETLSPAAILRWAEQKFGDQLVLASSLGAEDQVLTHMVAQHTPSLEIITLDTGRLFPETYNLLDETRRRYKIALKVLFPESAAVEQMVNENGVNLFTQSVELRKKCCAVRKIGPLKRHLQGKTAWITGLRRDQSDNRSETRVIEWDNANQMYKINPLCAWSEEEIWAFIEEHHVPVNPLHKSDFPSIGCAPCTRAVLPGEDARAGRWWWEPKEHNECGLHLINGKLQRKVPVLVE